MGQPSVDNATPFAVEPLFLCDADGRPLLVPLIKATFRLSDRGLALAGQQQPVLPAGVPWGEPGKCSYRYEPECAPLKVATDVVLVGSAVAPRTHTTEVLVAFSLGPVRKGVRVVGDRVFYKAAGRIGLSRPAPFERIPLQWERAFGGWDRSAAAPEVEPRNPVGTGFRGKHTQFEEGVRAPNLEDPARPLRAWGERVVPCGVGFTCPDWQPRASFGGTYDEAWQKDRAPLLAKDFDPRFHSAAAPGLVAPGYLRGDEPVVVTGVTPSGGLSFKLPGVPPPQVTVAHVARADAPVAVHLDTVVVDTDALLLVLTWRGQLRVREPTAVRTIRVVEQGGQPWAASA